MSMKPGVTAHPDASSSRAPSRFGPISRITLPAIATSATRPAEPVPSKTVPPRTTRSCICDSRLRFALRGGAEILDRTRRSAGGRATVDGQDDARDLGGPVARQVQERFGNVL